jgi:hypothetical protein
VDQASIEHVADEHLGSLRAELGLPRSIAEKAGRAQPMLVKDLAGDPSYWLVPIELEDRLVGFLRLGLDGAVLAYGRFGQARELRGFPALSYLSEQTADSEIREAFGDDCEEIGRPQLVHDGPVDRIAWLSRGRSADGTRMLLFWTFGSAYSRPEGEEAAHGLL